MPTALLQAAQRTIHARVIAVAVEAPDRTDSHNGDRGVARVLRLIGRAPALQRLIGYMMAIGPLPERAPKFARRHG
jgi:hypothetical protein